MRSVRAEPSFFFDRLADYFFGEGDIAFVKSCGANRCTFCRSTTDALESDAEPGKYLEPRFRSF